MDWSKVQAVVALALVIFGIPLFWWRMGGRAAEWIRLKLRSQDGRCDYLSWDDIPNAPTASVHPCTGHWQPCPHGVHRAGSTCWKETISSFFDIKHHPTIPKPKGLLPTDRFLAVDKKILFAVILCSIKDWDCAPVWKAPKKFECGGICLEPKQDGPSGEVVLHMDGFSFSRDLRKREIDLLLEGYPPFWREEIECNGRLVRSQIKEIRDLRRGGWVVGVGMSSTLPVPVYMDTMGDPSKNIRATVFLEGMTRVKDILADNVQPAFPQDQIVAAAIQGVQFMIQRFTDSGVEKAIEGSGLREVRGVMSPDQCKQVMRMFNADPGLTATQMDRLKAFLEPILHPVVQAAFIGVEKCMVYAKNPGRELNRMIPELLDNADQVFLTGCTVNV